MSVREREPEDQDYSIEVPVGYMYHHYPTAESDAETNISQASYRLIYVPAKPSMFSVSDDEHSTEDNGSDFGDRKTPMPTTV